MVYNVSYNRPKVDALIKESVGSSYSIFQRIKTQTFGSPPLLIESCSTEIHQLISVDSKTDIGNIEIRPNGILFRFKSYLETYALVIPFYQLTIYRNGESYSIHAGQNVVKVRSKHVGIHGFFQKLLTLKAQSESEFSRIEEL